MNLELTNEERKIVDEAVMMLKQLVERLSGPEKQKEFNRRVTIELTVKPDYDYLASPMGQFGIQAVWRVFLGGEWVHAQRSVDLQGALSKLATDSEEMKALRLVEQAKAELGRARKRLREVRR